MLQQSLSTSYNLFQSFQYVGTAPNRAEALERYIEEYDLLKEWRILYADDEKNGPFSLRRADFGKTGFVSTIFRGKSIWIFDSDVVACEGIRLFPIGTGTYLDANAASYIRSLAYKPKPRSDVLDNCQALSNTFSLEELQRLNPYLYLWEVQRNRTEKDIMRIRETIAAISAIPMINQPLNMQWRDAFRAHYQLEAEQEADRFLRGFYQNVDLRGGNEIETLVDQMELILLKTKLIEYRSNRLAENKMEELINIMSSQISTFMYRELVICTDILFHEKKNPVI